VSRSRDITQRGRIAATSLVHRLTGFSLPFFGVQWTPPADEREIVRGLLTALEDRRVLFVPYHLEVVSQVTSSVLQMREILTKTLQALPETSRAAGSIRAMRAACRRFLEEPMPDFRNVMRWRHRGDEEGDPSFFRRTGRAARDVRHAHRGSRISVRSRYRAGAGIDPSVRRRIVTGRIPGGFLKPACNP
jgi:hypothetical protein